MKITRRDLAFGAAATIAGSSLLRSDLVFAAPQVSSSSVDGAIDPMSLINPELRPALESMLQPSMSLPPLSKQGLADIRKFSPASPILPSPAPPVKRLSIPGRRGDPDVKIQVIGAAQKDRLRPAVLHIHGGGYILGSAEQAIPDCQRLSRDLDCVVVNVDYRLAPETPFPGSLEDNYAALRWLHDKAKTIGVDRSRIAVKGESAGGGHAAALAIAARDRGEVKLCYQVLIYPMLDDRTGSTRKPPPFIGAFGWTAPQNEFGWSSLLGLPAGSAQVPAGSVPARVTNLAGLPPAFVGVGSVDLFVDEDIDYARLLVNAGVSTELCVMPGAFHGFDAVVPDAQVSREFTAAWTSALKTALTQGV